MTETITVSITLFDVFLKVVFKFKEAFSHVTRNYVHLVLFRGKHLREVYFDIKLILINSSNWPWFCVEVLSKGSHRKYTKGNGQLLVAGKRLTLGVRGPGEKPSWGET